MRELERELTYEAPPKAGGRPIPPLAVIGAGRAGGAIAGAAKRSGIRVELADRDRAVEACRRAEAALLCVPDAAITEACEAIAVAIPPLRLVGHSSGVTALEALQAAGARGAQTFSLHPLQTIPDAGADLTGAPCAVWGSSEEGVGFATLLAERLGMRPFEVPDHARAAYHAAASIASNLLVALEESAAEVLARAGIESGRELLTPLVLRSAANWAERGPAALTGPIARGDAATAERHTEALRELAPELLPMYEELAGRARVLATEAGRAGA